MAIAPIKITTALRALIASISRIHVLQACTAFIIPAP